MLFGDFFKDAIFVDRRASIRRWRNWPKEFHGAGRRWRCTRSPRLPFWLALAGVVVAWFLYLVKPAICRPAIQRASRADLHAARQQVLLRLVQRERLRRRRASRSAAASGRAATTAVIDGHRQRQRAVRRLVRRRDPLPAVRLHLPLRVRHDHRHVRALDPVCNARRQIQARDTNALLSDSESRDLAADRLRPPGAGCRLATDNPAPARWIALIGSVVELPRHDPADHRLRLAHGGDAVRRDRRLDRALQHQLPPRRRRHLDVVRRC